MDDQVYATYNKGHYARRQCRYVHLFGLSYAHMSLHFHIWHPWHQLPWFLPTHTCVYLLIHNTYTHNAYTYTLHLHTHYTLHTPAYTYLFITLIPITIIPITLIPTHYPYTHTTPYTHTHYTLHTLYYAWPPRPSPSPMPCTLRPACSVNRKPWQQSERHDVSEKERAESASTGREI